MRLGIIMAAAALLAGCAAGPGMGRIELASTLTGHQAVPGPGNLEGTGSAVVRVNPGAPALCWDLALRGIGAVSAAHIHRAAAGSSGPPVVPLTTPGADGRSEGCTAIDEQLARDIVLAPHEFYINVHTAAFPSGAVRGQLRVRRLSDLQRGRSGR